MVQETVKVTPDETGGVLFYLAGSKTNELLSDNETLEKLGLADADRDDLYLEMTILNMFLIINQYTHWEKNEAVYSKALDKMHFLFFHQLKEYSGFDQSDIEQLHQHIFQRYAQYGDAMDINRDRNRLEVLSELLLDIFEPEIDDKKDISVILAEYIEKFYKAIPSVLKTM